MKFYDIFLVIYIDYFHFAKNTHMPPKLPASVNYAECCISIGFKYWTSKHLFFTTQNSYYKLKQGAVKVKW